MNISQVAQKSGLPPKTIHYYEDIGLLTPARGDNGYPSFYDTDMHKLAFLGRSRALGFTIEDCRRLLALREGQERASADVRALAKDRIARIEQKITDLQAMRDTLGTLVKSCAADDRANCPILNNLDDTA